MCVCVRLRVCARVLMEGFDNNTNKRPQGHDVGCKTTSQHKVNLQTHTAFSELLLFTRGGETDFSLKQKPLQLFSLVCVSSVRACAWRVCVELLAPANDLRAFFLARAHFKHARRCVNTTIRPSVSV